MRYTANKLCALLLCALSFNLFASAPEVFTWEEQQYQQQFFDFNDDGITDLFLQSLSEEYPAMVVLGDMVDGNVSYLPENQLTLPQLIDGNSWSVEYASIVVADFNGDNKYDMFFVFPQIQQAVTYLGSKEGIDFSTPPSHTYTTDNLTWLKDEFDFHLYKGDFNGDKKHDLLAISQGKNSQYLMHSDDSGLLSVKQVINKNSKWSEANNVTLLIKDFNKDGKVDIFALAKESNNTHYLILSNSKGELGKETKIKNKLNDKYWNSDDYSIVINDADNDGSFDLIRLNNMPGGIDEKEALVESSLLSDFDNLEDDCDQLYYSVSKKESDLTCSPWEKVTTNNAQSFVPVSRSTSPTKKTSTLSSVNSMAMECSPLDPCGEVTPPSTPTSVPTVGGGSYHPVSSQIAVFYNAIPYANYYQVYMSTYDGGYSLVKTTSSTSASITIRSGWGYNYIKYRACNTTGGCSGLSPWRRIVAYESPYKTYPSVSPNSVYKNATSTISWSNPGHILWSGTHYELKYTKPNGTSISLGNVTHTGGINSYSKVSPALSQYGTYTFYVRACNPILPCGSWGSASVTVVNRAPNAVNDSATLDEGESVTISVLNNDSDPDGDTITVTSNTNPSKGSVSCNSTSCTYTASSSLSADTSTSFNYTISDGNGGSYSATVSLAINNLSEGTVSTPSISPSTGTYQDSKSIGISTTTSGASVYYRIGSTGSYSLYSGSFTLSDTATIYAYATKFDWITSGTDTATITIENAINNIPTISGIPNLAVIQGAVYSFTPIAEDVDGDTLTFSITNKPAWAVFDVTTGELLGTPTISDIGIDTNIIISVTDAIESVSLTAFAIEVKSNTVIYKYDARGRLINVIHSMGNGVSYHYDDAGNRTTTGSVQ